jgi:creatinine amidohydrolase/Fe(II)-dependent formamide hydrolase-like protein
MTFTEFEAAVKKTNIALIPIGAIEEHGPHLPLDTDSTIATAQMVDVQRFLRNRGVESLVAPPLNAGITTDSEDWSRDGTYTYPGSLTISAETFVSLYLDLIRSLRDNGLTRVFIYSGHYGPRHLRAVVRIAEEAAVKVAGTKVYALVASESAERLSLRPAPHLLIVERGRNFSLLSRLLAPSAETPTSLHADGAETSEMLYRAPAAVRSGYKRLDVAPSSRFFEAYRTGDRFGNPGGMGGFPLDKASPRTGKAITEYRTVALGDRILREVRRN